MAEWVIHQVDDVQKYGYTPNKQASECAAAWIHPGLELVHLEGMGRTLRATQDVARGTLILREAPLITTLPMDAVPEDLQMKYQEAVRALGCTAAPLLDVHAYVHAAPGLRSTLLRSCCTFRATDPPQPPNEDGEVPGILETARRVARWCLLNLEACKELCEEELVQAQGVFALNAHNLGDDPGAAVYLVGSKISHCCVQPNTVYHWHPETQMGEHRVLRRLRKGDVLTSDYMGFLNVCSASLRQSYLANTKLFACQCRVCLGEDLPRRLPCPACMPRNPDGQLDEASLVGPLNLWLVEHPCVVRHPDGAHPPGGAWRCQTCSRAFDDAQVNVACLHNDEVKPLFVWERKIEMLVHSLMQATPNVDAEGNLHPRIKSLTHMLESFSQVVGLQHWATVELRSIQLEHWIWMTRNLSGKKLKNALTDAGYFYTQKSSFYHEIWHSVRTIWDWQERCGHVGVWSIVGDLIGVLQLVELVGDDSCRFMDLLRITEERAIVEYGAESEEVDRLLDSYADLYDECPELFVKVEDIEERIRAIVLLGVDTQSEYVSVLVTMHCRLSS